MTSLQSKFNATVKRLAPSGAGFITGAITAGVLYLANHVFHVHLLSTTVENELTPVIAFALASVAHNGAKIQTAVSDAIGKAQTEVSKIEADDPIVKILLTATAAQLKSHPEFKGDVTKLLLAELSKAEAASPVVHTVSIDAQKVVAAIKADEPTVTAHASGMGGAVPPIVDTPQTPAVVPAPIVDTPQTAAVVPPPTNAEVVAAALGVTPPVDHPTGLNAA